MTQIDTPSGVYAPLSLSRHEYERATDAQVRALMLAKAQNVIDALLERASGEWRKPQGETSR